MYPWFLFQRGALTFSYPNCTSLVHRRCYTERTQGRVQDFHGGGGGGDNVGAKPIGA